MNASREKGRDLLTEQTFALLKVISHFLRDKQVGEAYTLFQRFAGKYIRTPETYRSFKNISAELAAALVKENEKKYSEALYVVEQSIGKLTGKRVLCKRIL